MSPDSRREQKAGDGAARGTRAGHDHTHVGQTPSSYCRGVGERREDDNRRAMLVVVEYGDVKPSLEQAFDLETARRGDVFEVDTAE